MSIQLVSWVLEESPATGNDRLVLIAIANHANKDQPWAFVSYETIAHEARVSRATAIRCMNRCIENGWIDARKSSGRRCNEYLLVTEQPSQSATVEPSHEPSQPDGSTVAAGAANRVTVATRTVEPCEPVEPPSSTVVDRAETERQFEHFWNAYPKRNGKRLGRSDALLHFGRLSLDDRRAAFRGAQHYAAACDAGATIAADAFRWLRKRSFEDWQTPAEPDRRPVSTRRQNPVDATAANGAEFLRIVNGGRA